MSVVLRDFQANPVAVLVYFRTESIPISGTPAVRPPLRLATARLCDLVLDSLEKPWHHICAHSHDIGCLNDYQL